jgi:hypothetical protein
MCPSAVVPDERAVVPRPRRLLHRTTPVWRWMLPSTGRLSGSCASAAPTWSAGWRFTMPGDIEPRHDLVSFCEERLLEGDNVIVNAALKHTARVCCVRTPPRCARRWGEYDGDMLLDLKRLFDLWVEHYEMIPDVERGLLPLKAVWFLGDRNASKSQAFCRRAGSARISRRPRVDKRAGQASATLPAAVVGLKTENKLSSNPRGIIRAAGVACFFARLTLRHGQSIRLRMSGPAAGELRLDRCQRLAGVRSRLDAARPT